MATKRKQVKSITKPRRLPPIVIVPDKSYIDDTGNVIPTDVILIADTSVYSDIVAILKFGEKELPDVPREKGIIKA